MNKYKKLVFSGLLLVAASSFAAVTYTWVTITDATVSGMGMNVVDQTALNQCSAMVQGSLQVAAVACCGGTFSAANFVGNSYSGGQCASNSSNLRSFYTLQSYYCFPAQSRTVMNGMVIYMSSPHEYTCKQLMGPTPSPSPSSTPNPTPRPTPTPTNIGF